MGIKEETPLTGGYVMTSVTLPIAIAKEVKRLGIGYRGLIMRGLKALSDDDNKYKGMQEENTLLKHKIEKMSLRLEEMALETGRFKRELEALK